MPATYIRNFRGAKEARRISMGFREWKSRVIFVVGPTDVGKTHFVHEVFIILVWWMLLVVIVSCTNSNSYNIFIQHAGPDAFWSSQTKWWDGYEGQPNVVLDEFTGWLSIPYMLRLLDKYKFTVETKGGHINFIARTIYITSNTAPTTWYPGFTYRDPSLVAFCRKIDIVYWMRTKHDVLVYEGQNWQMQFDKDFNRNIVYNLDDPRRNSILNWALPFDREDRWFFTSRWYVCECVSVCEMCVCV
jgi:hypothetical protein